MNEYQKYQTERKKKILADRKTGMTYAELGNKYNISATGVRKIVLKEKSKK